MNHRSQVAVLAIGLWLSAGQTAQAQQAVSATFGDVIQVQGGTPSDIVLDELRHQLYLVSNTTSQVLVFDYTTNQVVAKIATGRTPLAGAMSMDGNFLYVTASGPPSALYAIDLTSNQMAYSQTLPSTPQGVETGIDGRVLVAMAGTGVTSGVPQKTLQVFDPVAKTLTDVAVPALATTLAPLPAQATGRPTTTFPGKLLRTPDGSFIVGVITPTAGSTYIFVYEVASGVILRNRTTAGQSTVISMAPDGSRFMAGFTMYDTATLAVVAQQNNANAPFTFTSAVNTTQNVGGSIFSPDGATLYSAFNTAATTNPPSPSLSSTLLVNDPTNLGIRLGINLPESIVAKIAMTSDGANAWGLSDSGMVHLPLGNLYQYPILMPETSMVFLAMDDWYRFPSGRWTIPESLNPQAFAPSLVIAILATMLSGRLMPRRIPRFVGSLTSSVEDSEGEGGLVVAAVLNALYRVAPSGEKMLPPTFCVVFTADVKVNGALALFCCATTASVAVSYMVNPAMKREPSGAIEITVLCPAVVRLRRITPEATS